MKIPLPKEDASNGMMMSGSSTGRKELIHDLRETSLIGGNAILRREVVDKAVQGREMVDKGIQRLEMVDKAVQFRPNMDLGSGDTTDYIFVSEPTAVKGHVLETSLSLPPPPPSPSTPPLDKLNSSSSESINNKWSVHDKSDSEHLFRGKVNNKLSESKDSTSAVVEESKRPNFRANESNPTVPSPKEPSKTSTLRLSDRPRSESEDDIEKLDDPEQDGAIFQHKALYKTKAITEDLQSSEKMDKNRNRSDSEQNEVDNDCIVQCLYYTIQCCECVTF